MQGDRHRPRRGGHVVHERPQRQPAHALIPVEHVALDVRPGVIRVIRAVHDAQILGQVQPFGGTRVGKARDDHRVRAQGQQLAPGERAERQLEQQQQRLAQPAGAAERQIDHRVRQIVGLGEHGADVGQIRVLDRFGEHHRDLVETQAGIGLDQAPDLGGNHLELAPHPRAGQDLQAAIGGQRRIGLRRGGAIEDVVLQPAEQGRRRGLDATTNRPAKSPPLRSLSRRMFSRPGPSPQAQRQILVAALEAVGVLAQGQLWLATGARGERLAGLAALAAQPLAQLGRALDVLPELAAGIQRVQAHLAAAAKRAEHLVVGARDVRDAEDVHGLGLAVGIPARRGLERTPQLAQGQARGSTRRARQASQATARAEDAQPQRALPRLDVAVKLVVGQGRAFAPRHQQLRARGAVLVEQATELGGQPRAAAIDGVGPGARAHQVLAHGGQHRRRKKRLVMKQRQQVALDLARVDQAGARRDLARQAFGQALQERDLQVGRDPQRLGDPVFDVGLDVAVGHHQAHGHEGAGARAFAPDGFAPGRPAALRFGSNRSGGSCRGIGSGGKTSIAIPVAGWHKMSPCLGRRTPPR